SAETDSREDRLENLKRLYEAGILSREEYDERRKKL
ncbi:MAG: SHOCT domain-containing protein, partial [Oscillibacter sp.]